MRIFSRPGIWILVALSLLLVVHGFSADRGLNVSVTTPLGENLELYDESYALVVGNGTYTGGWNDLPGALIDARDIARVLEKNGFTVILKTDLTVAAFNKVFSQFALKYGANENNRLLFYYAGHGHTETMANGGELGYLVMIDAPLPEDDRVEFVMNSVDMESVVTKARLIRARHVLFMFDSCFSGTILNVRSRTVPSYISDTAKYPVRQFITAGRANEPVPDRSIFKEAFLDLLEGRVREPIPDGYVTGEELGYYLQATVPKYSDKQHPQYGKIRDIKLDKGNFIFKLNKDIVKRQKKNIIMEDWNLALFNNTEESYQRFITHYQDEPLAAQEVSTGHEKIKQLKALTAMKQKQAQRIASIEEAWTRTRAANKQAHYEEFINKFQNEHLAASYVEEARTELEKLLKAEEILQKNEIMAAWEEVQKSDQPEKYDHFINKYEQAPLAQNEVAAARKKKTAIQRDLELFRKNKEKQEIEQTWQKVREIDNRETYQEFIRKNKNNPLAQGHVLLAQSRREEIINQEKTRNITAAWQEASNAQTEEALEKFIASYENNYLATVQVNEARNLLQNMIANQKAIREEAQKKKREQEKKRQQEIQDAWSQALNEDTSEAYIGFMKKYNEDAFATPQILKAEYRLGELKKQKEIRTIQNQWAQVQKSSSDDQIRKFIQQYVSNYLAQKEVAQAREMLQQRSLQLKEQEQQRLFREKQEQERLLKEKQEQQKVVEKAWRETVNRDKQETYQNFTNLYRNHPFAAEKITLARNRIAELVQIKLKQDITEEWKTLHESTSPQQVQRFVEKYEGNALAENELMKARQLFAKLSQKERDKKRFTMKLDEVSKAYYYKDIRINVRAKGPDVQLRLYYKSRKNPAYISLPMKLKKKGKYTATIPKQHVSDHLYYYVEAVDETGAVFQEGNKKKPFQITLRQEKRIDIPVVF
ncbi:caspase family protein [candidate division CSSED10-310 bacterium]|uniref:Caspase family protein n=1 Tax=candidate division CSSED10-310 bacterium TaxID=2855610 RepID=A0ABV6YWP8_UNCC1